MYKSCLTKAFVHIYLCVESIKETKMITALSMNALHWTLVGWLHLTLWSQLAVLIFYSNMILKMATCKSFLRVSFSSSLFEEMFWIFALTFVPNKKFLLPFVCLHSLTYFINLCVKDEYVKIPHNEKQKYCTTTVQQLYYIDTHLKVITIAVHDILNILVVA